MPPTLGQQLRAAREARHLTLADLAHETRIPEARLAELESDDFALPTEPHGTYARLFLRTYAARLGVSDLLQSPEDSLANGVSPSTATPRFHWKRWRLPERAVAHGLATLGQAPAGLRSRLRLAKASLERPEPEVRSSTSHSRSHRDVARPTRTTSPTREATLGRGFKVAVALCAGTLILGASLLLAQAYQSQKQLAQQQLQQQLAPATLEQVDHEAAAAQDNLQVEVRRAEPLTVKDENPRAMDNLPTPPKAVAISPKDARKRDREKTSRREEASDPPIIKAVPVR